MNTQKNNDETLQRAQEALKPGTILGIWDSVGEAKTQVLEELVDFGRELDMAESHDPNAFRGIISRAAQTRLIVRELDNDDSDFIEGGVDSGTRLSAWISAGKNPGAARRWAGELGLEACMERGLKYLSTGELRKAMLARLASEGLPLLALDEVMEGVDLGSRKVIPRIIASAMAAGLIVQLASGELAADLGLTRSILQDLAQGHGFRMEELTLGSLVPPGLSSAQESTPGQRQEAELRLLKASLGTSTAFDARGRSAGEAAADLPLVRMKNVQVAWDGIDVLKDFDWEVWPGEHTFVQGPNGCGKTSLLRLITGDNPQVYANHVEVCGIRRGSGESIWEVKSHLGYVSHKFHMDYLYHGDWTRQEVIMSGHHDTIGLYEPEAASELRQAQDWLDFLGLGGTGKESFASLDWGRQRMLLVARALVKAPELLLLDEPCQGLDARDRQIFLELLDTLAEQHHSTIIHVSHDPDECRRFYPYVLESKGRGLAWSLIKRR